MVQQEMMNVIDSYGKAIRTWSDVFTSCNRPMINFPSALSVINMECWSKPFQSHLAYWNKRNSDCFKIMTGMCFPPKSMNNINKASGDCQDSKPAFDK
ncbi:hypothetical protein QUF75_05820 [Desulfococcaceae bacterium HSG7]|nr:hypothetical protein [Desulfococcaceae bacterium HSG7]